MRLKEGGTFKMSIDLCASRLGDSIDLHSYIDMSGIFPTLNMARKGER
jgi:hypothetical protein